MEGGVGDVPPPLFIILSLLATGKHVSPTVVR